MYAYIVPDLSDISGLDRHPAGPILRRISPTWQGRSTTAGLLLALPGWPAQAADYGPPQPSLFPGLQYLPPADAAADWRALARDEIPPSVPVRLASGLDASIALGLDCPLALTIASPGHIVAHEPATMFGRLAWRLYDMDQERSAAIEAAAEEGRDPPPLSPEHLALRMQVVVEALRECYMLSDDAINTFRPLATTDSGPVLTAVWGADPKACGSGGAISPGSPLPPHLTHA